MTDPIGTQVTEYEYKREVLACIRAAVTFDWLQHRAAQREVSQNRHTPVEVVQAYLAARFKTEILVATRTARLLLDAIESEAPVLLIGAPGGGKTATLIFLKRELDAALHLASADVTLADEELPGSEEHGLQSTETVAPEDAPPLVEPRHLIVFNGNQNVDQLKLRRTVSAKAEYISDRIANALYRRFASNLGNNIASDEWLAYLALHAQEFAGFSSVYQTTTPEELRSLLNCDATARLDFGAALDRFNNNLPAIDRLRALVPYLNRRGIHLAIAIDNCDPLSNADLQAAKVAASGLAGLTTHGLPVIIASRPSTKTRAALHLLGYAPYTEFRLNAFESLNAPIRDDEDDHQVAEDLTHTLEIFDRRLRIFSDPRLVKALADAFVEKYGASAHDNYRDFRRDVTRYRNAAKRILRDYLRFNWDGENESHLDSVPLTLRAAADHSLDRDVIDDRGASINADLTTSFIMWHNGSLREFAAGLSDHIRVYLEIFHEDQVGLGGSRQTSSSPIGLDGLFSPGAVRNPRTILFRHLIFQKTSREDVDADGFPEMHPSLSILDEVGRQKNGQLGSARARVLQYLNARRDEPTPVTFGRLSSDFSMFKVDGAQLAATVVELSSRPGYESGLIRIDSSSSDVYQEMLASEAIDVEPASELELLPAGQLLVERLCYVVEFLYWSAVRDREARGAVAQELGIDERVLTDRSYFNRAARRVEVALAYLATVALPRFEVEHSYMAEGHTHVTVAESMRLREFARLFGFGEGDWYLDRAIKQIDRFTRREAEHGRIRNVVSVSEGALRRRAAVLDATARLDAVYRANH